MRVLAPATVAGTREPEVPPPDVSVVLPPLGSVRGVAERMVRVDGEKGRVRLEARGGEEGGKFRMGVGSEEVKVESVWVGLKTAGDGQQEGEEERGTQEGEEGWAGVTVNGRDWARVLKCGGRGEECCCL